MTRKRVLIFQVEIGTDGISKLLSNFIDNYSDRIEIEILTFKVSNPIYFKNKNIKIHFVTQSKNSLKRLINERRIMKQGFDVIHINGNYISRIIECIAAKFAGIKKIIIHSHNDGSGNNNNIKRFFQFFFKKLFDFFATDYVSCSKNSAKWMFSNKIIKSNQFTVINNGIDINLFKFNLKLRNEIRKKYELQDKFVIGCIGRFCYQKNHDFLIDIFYECKRIKKNVILFLIGDGVLKPQIISKIKKLNLEDSVVLLENISDTYKYYNCFDCFVLPSRYEGLGIVNIEAQCNGLDTFVSDKIPEEANVSKKFHSIKLNDSPNTWAKHICSINTDLDKRKSEYKSIINNNFDIESASKQMEELYLK